MTRSRSQDHRLDLFLKEYFLCIEPGAELLGEYMKLIVEVGLLTEKLQEELEVKNIAAILIMRDEI